MPTTKTKVLIVDDHPVTLAGIRSILEDNDNIEIIGEAKDGHDAVNQVDAKKPDIVVMDITMPNLSGIDATREIINKYPDMRVIALSIHAGEKFVKEMLDAGASGYLLKDEMPEELITGINTIVKGNMYLSAGVTKVALRKNNKEGETIEKKVHLSKLLRPPIMPDYVIRSGIIDELERNILKPLSLISAGAGYGKSVTISQWLEQTNHMKSWISLDVEHNDLRTFLNYLVVSIERIFPGKLENTRSYLTATRLPSVHEIARITINELCDIDDYFILVLDDYQLIKESRIHDLLNEWLHFPPSSVHLCIITRRDPPLELNALKLSGRMTDIRMRELSFTRDEVAELFKQTLQVDLEYEALKIIQNKTEGWIIALRLVSMISNNQEEIGQRLKSVKGGLISISEYLMTEVLSKQSEQFQNQLIKTSILNRFCSELIEEIINEDTNVRINKDGFNLIQYLEKANMFIKPLVDNEQKWFRYHHLFQEFLQDELKERKTEHQINDIHNRASRWFEKQGLITEAVEYASKANDTEQIVRIIYENWEAAFDEDHWDSVEKWLAVLPEVLITQSSDLLFARLWISHRIHRLKQMAKVINQLEQLNVNFTDKEKGYLLFAKCMISYYSDAPAEDVLTLARQALQLIPEKYASFRGSIPLYIFFSLQSSGQVDLALQFIEDNIKNAEGKGELISLMRFKVHRGHYALFNTDLPMLEYAVKKCFKMPALTAWISGHVWYLKQCIGWWSYNPKLVIETTENLSRYKYVSTFREVIDIYICRILAHQELNKTAEAREELSRAFEYAIESADTILIESCRARLNISQGNLDASIKWLNETESSSLDPTMLFWVEVPAITRCRVLIASGTSKDLQQALELLTEFRAYSESVFNKLRIIEIIVLQAITLKKLGKQQEAITTLKNAIELADKGEWIRPFAEYGEEVSDLLLHLIETGVNPGFIDRIFETIQKVRNTAAETIKDTTSVKKKEKQNVFTPREIEVLQCIAEGYRNHEIAEKLFISEETIKKHINNMFNKMHVKNRLSLVTIAREDGFLKSE